MDYLTTGEAARLLNISRSTVSRRFDAGELQGTTNRITGERLVSRASIQTFMEAHGLSTTGLHASQRRVVVASTDQALLDAVAGIFEHDRRIERHTVELGSDALIACSSQSTRLAIIADDLPDLPLSGLVKALRRSDSLRAMKLLCCTHDASLASEPGVDGILDVRTLNAEALADRLYALLELPRTVPSEAGGARHQRRWPRIGMKLPCAISFYPSRAPRQRSTGDAELRNISRGGALVSVARLSAPIPGEPFHVLLEVDRAPLPQWRATCRVVRLESNGSLMAGLQFLNLTRDDEQKLEAIWPVWQAPLAGAPVNAGTPAPAALIEADLGPEISPSQT